MNLYSVSLPDRPAILTLLSLDDFKEAQRITHAYEDAFLTNCIVDAFRHIDGRHGWLGRAVLTQQWRMTLPRFCASIEIPLPPLVSVDRVTYRDADGATVVLLATGDSPPVTTAVCHTVVGDYFGHIDLLYEQVWPTTQRHPEAVEITFTAGWADGAPELDVARRGLLFLAGHLMRNREATVLNTERTLHSQEIELGLEEFLGSIRTLPDIA